MRYELGEVQYNTKQMRCDRPIPSPLRSSTSTMAQQTDSHSCDTLPRARPSSPSLAVSEDHWSSRPPSPSSHPIPDVSPSALSQPAPRKLCIRHQRIADEGTNLKLQQVRPNRSPFSSLPQRFSSLYLITCLGRHFQCAQYMRLFIVS